MHRFHAILLGLAFAVPACGHPLPPSIVVHAAPSDTALTASGSATIAVAPDCADLTLVVSSDSPRPGDAIAEVQKRQARLVAALGKLGVADADLAISSLGVEPTYHYDGEHSVLDGFHAHVTITATTRAFEQIAPLMQTAADNGVTEMSSQFRNSDLESLRQKVRDQALAAAQAKAKETAAVLGLTLGRITAVSDASPSYLYSNEYFPSSGGGGGIGAERQPLTIEVTLTYEI